MPKEILKKDQNLKKKKNLPFNSLRGDSEKKCELEKKERKKKKIFPGKKIHMEMQWLRKTS